MNETFCAEFVGTLLHSSTVTHFMHLQTKSYAAHMALGSYYEEVIDLVDGLAESIQGKYGIIEDYGRTFGVPNSEPVAYFKSLTEYVDRVREDMPADTEIQNDIDSIMTLINSTVYKLRFLA